MRYFTPFQRFLIFHEFSLLNVQNLILRRPVAKSVTCAYFSHREVGIKQVFKRRQRVSFVWSEISHFSPFWVFQKKIIKHLIVRSWAMFKSFDYFAFIFFVKILKDCAKVLLCTPLEIFTKKSLAWFSIRVDNWTCLF